MLRLLLKIFLVAMILGAAIAAIGVYRSDLFAPPTPTFLIANEPVDGYTSIEGTVLELAVSVEHADPTVSAVLYLLGAEVEAVPFSRNIVSFEPVVLPPGR